MWYYRKKEFTSDDICDNIGFVYIITEKSTGKKYVGKKLFVSKRRLPPLKGMKRKRTVVKESDWMDYYGSSETVKALLEQHGADSFHREILHLCKTRGEMSYKEAKEQFDRDVLLRDDYYNGIIAWKINQSAVKHMKEKYNETN